MIPKKVKLAYEKIKGLEIQGARAISSEAVKSLRGINKISDLRESVKYLRKSRPTEPMMRNALRYVLHKAGRSRRKDVGEVVDKSVREFLKMSDNTIKKISQVGARRIEDDSNVMVFCHSSTVMAILKEAWNNGLDFKVYAAETRPLFQGRLTAKELSTYGIPVTVFVDSAVRHLINNMDLALLGVDAITSDGHVINKIGTSIVALCAHEARTDCAFASELFKFDPLTTKGMIEPIEKRDPEEVWDKSPKGVKILNPAFDVTPPEYINYIITEVGILNPFNVINVVEDVYPWIMK